MLERFAGYAGLSLREAIVIDQLERLKKTTEAVSEVMTLGNLPATLNSIAKATKDAVGCQSVVIFEYDSNTQRLRHPPTMIGVNNPDSAKRGHEVRANSIVYHILKLRSPLFVESVMEHPLFSPRRFAARRDSPVLRCNSIVGSGSPGWSDVCQLQ